MVHPRRWRDRFLEEATEAFAAGVAHRRGQSGCMAARRYALRAVTDALIAGWRNRMGRGRGKDNGRKRGRTDRILDTLRGDLRYVLRRLRRALGFSLGVTLTLALGIGANATMFGIVDRLLLSPPEHVLDADQVHRIYLWGMDLFDRSIRTSQSLTYGDFADLKKVGAFSMVAAYTDVHEITLGPGIDSEQVMGALASWELFPLLGVTPRIGRFYSPEEDRIGAPMTAVLGYGFWQRRFGEAPSVLGRTLSISGAPATVIGVPPRSGLRSG